MNRIKREDLLRLSREQLADLLEELLTGMSPGEQRKWIQRNLPEIMKKKKISQIDESELLEEIKAFCDRSYRGDYVSWVPDSPWEEGEEDYSNYEEWTEICSDLFNRTLEIASAKKYDVAARCFRSLFKLLKEARFTTDILGNQGTPEDSMQVDFREIIQWHTKSLLAIQSDLSDTINEMLPIVQGWHYRESFKGLAQALDANGREKLKVRLWEIINSHLREKEDRRWISPDEVDGLIAIAEEENNLKEVLSLKEKFAQRSPPYLQDVIDYYKKKKDWPSVIKWTKVGIKSFGQHEDYVSCLIKACETLGDDQSALQAHFEYFLENPSAKEFKKLKKRATLLSKWNETLKRIIAATKASKDHRWDKPGFRAKIQLAEGFDKEALEKVDVNVNLDFKSVKFIAKYALARATSDAELSKYPKLKELSARLKKEESDLYDWLRLSIKKEGQLREGAYVQLAFKMYYQLIEYHLNSGKSSRVRPAAHYCVIIFQLSLLTNKPALWTDLLSHLKIKHGRKRIIWQRLKDEGVVT